MPLPLQLQMLKPQFYMTESRYKVSSSKKLRLLIVYASYDGQTRCIAEAISKEAVDYAVTWCNLQNEIPPNPADFDKILVGASVRYGRFHPQLLRFVKLYKHSLMATNAAFFGVCLLARKPEKRSAQTNVYLRKFLKQSEWKPSKIAMFAGALYYSRYTWLQTCLLRFILFVTGGPTAVDKDIEFTDWSSVKAFSLEFFSNIVTIR